MMHMTSLAFKDLFYERGKFALVFCGLTVSMVMILFGIGMLVGGVSESALLVDKTHYDIWVAQDNRNSLASSSTVADTIAEQIAALPECDHADQVILTGGEAVYGNFSNPVYIVA